MIYEGRNLSMLQQSQTRDPQASCGPFDVTDVIVAPFILFCGPQRHLFSICGPRALFLPKCGPQTNLSLRPLLQMFRNS